MRKHRHRVVIDQVGAHRHLAKPFAALNRQKRVGFLVENIHRAKRPAVRLQCLAVLLGRVAPTFIKRVRLNNRGAGQIFFEKCLDPGVWKDVGAVGLAGVELDGHTPVDTVGNRLPCFAQAFCRKVAREVDD